MVWRISSIKVIAILVIASVIAVMGMEAGAAQAGSKKSVLVLNSYHKGYKWSDDIIAGIVSVLGPLGPNIRNTEIIVEEMDTQRISDDEYLLRLLEIYKYKFRDKKFDVIIASDDPAFHFLLQYHQELFPGTPVIFCGVNYFDDAMLAGRELFTGVVEGQDINATLGLALKLHPNTRHIYVINDKTITGNAIAKELAAAMPYFSDRVRFISLSDYNIEQIEQIVADLPPDSLILFGIMFQDAAGNKFSYDESISRISAVSRAPIYGLWDFVLGHGIVGGMLTSGYYQGQTVATIAQRVLNGEQVAAIPVEKTSPNRFMFDGIQMKRFGIEASGVPRESIIINDLYSTKKQVLVLNSYHYGMRWTDGLNEGVRAELAKQSDIDVYFDFMDTKRNTGPEYLGKLYEIYKYKFSNKHFDAVVASDDDAYHLMLKYHQEIFPNVPIVFCGVNYFEDSDVKDDPLITGVVELVDIQKTLEVASKLHSQVKNIVVINDQTSTGMANKKIIESVIPNFPELTFIFFEDMNMREVQDKVAALTDDSLILLMTFNKDKSNNVYSYEESLHIIAKQAKVPIYGVWDFYLGQGIIGGMLTTGYSQGETAAKMVRRILAGEEPKHISIIKESPNQYMFDYKYLADFKVAEDKLPKGSIVVNKPIALYEKYQTAFLTALLLVTASLLLIQRRKARKQLEIFATTDALTGVLNRRTGVLLLEKQLELAKRQHNKLTVCFVDINDLKVINDTYGHAEGDKLIQAVSKMLQRRMRKTDILCRFGGDEFLLVLINCDCAQANTVWEKIEEDIALFNKQSDYEYNISMSHGFYEYDPVKPVTAEEVVKIADAEMYACKREYKLSKEMYNSTSI